MFKTIKKGYKGITFKKNSTTITGVQIQCLQDQKSTHTLIVIYDNMVVCYYDDIVKNKNISDKEKNVN